MTSRGRRRWRRLKIDIDDDESLWIDGVRIDLCRKQGRTHAVIRIPRSTRSLLIRKSKRRKP